VRRGLQAAVAADELPALAPQSALISPARRAIATPDRTGRSSARSGSRS
jgi:hypothetical protein